ncbi:MAG: acyl-ACP--UDP-N-acetylglucosamine O-acyltransferase [Burkholderiales bacterium]|nr:acyl-ACP--UDP-N-acetylglucosamine O-acyltransferase [Burkholderiales bacterium]OUT76797.1 MAG: acyl-[acyl-carrier-protein]--UDP-N-acetylglucosamine O-acyltransferase [Betaproteobacteria bacterium TMED22]|tara:strand:- start:45829 stop:46602 length:774 start_codon:yes stop_codon:yes gene_type:complete
MIHQTAIVEPGAQISTDVEIGAYSLIGKNVSIGSGTRIGNHAVITGKTLIGRNNNIFHHVSLGEQPQDKKYAGEETTLEIGDENVIREFCSFNTGTTQDKAKTVVGNRNWIMAYVHIAHDCVVRDDVILANCTQLAGHVEVGDYAMLGGFSGVHQFCRIGSHALTGVGSVVLSDVPPYVTCSGDVAKPHGINAEGLKRRGFLRASIKMIRDAYKVLYRSSLSLNEARMEIDRMARESSELIVLSEFLSSTSGRSIIR